MTALQGWIQKRQAGQPHARAFWKCSGVGCGSRTAINLRKSLRAFAKPYPIRKSRTKSPCLPQQPPRSMPVRLVRLSTKSSVTTFDRLLTRFAKHASKPFRSPMATIGLLIK